MTTKSIVPAKLLAILVLLPLSFMIGSDRSISAQAKGEPARKFDEFGDVQYSDLIARLDNFAIALQAEPNSKGFIVAYRSRRDLPGLSNRTALRSKNYLVNSRGVSRERVTTVDGGDAGCLTQELWVAAPGATPTPRGDAYSRNFPDVESARKFDEYGYDLMGTSGRSESSESSIEADYLEPFANALRSQKHSLAYIIAYAHFTKSRQLVGDDNYDVHYERQKDPVGTARRRLAFEKSVLTRVYGIAPARIRLIDGGYRKWRVIELWIVPRGEHTPVPTPNSLPSKRPQSRK